jgi:hypothetical protein
MADMTVQPRPTPGHAHGRTNNGEAHVLFVAGEQTSSLTFRSNGLDVELFHILTFT